MYEPQQVRFEHASYSNGLNGSEARSLLNSSSSGSGGSGGGSGSGSVFGATKKTTTMNLNHIGIPHLLSNGPSPLSRSQSRSVYPYLRYCHVYAHIPEFDKIRNINEPLPPIEDIPIYSDNQLEEEAIKYVIDQREKQNQEIQQMEILAQQRLYQQKLKEQEEPTTELADGNNEAAKNDNTLPPLPCLEDGKLESSEKEENLEERKCVDIGQALKANNTDNKDRHAEKWTELTSDIEIIQDEAKNSMPSYPSLPQQVSPYIAPTPLPTPYIPYLTENEPKKNSVDDVSFPSLPSNDIQRQPSISDAILLNCDKDEQLSIWLQLEEDKKEKERLEKLRKLEEQRKKDPFFGMGIPLPKETLTERQQAQMDEFMNKTNRFDLEIAYGFLLQANWNVQDAVKQYESIKKQFAAAAKKKQKKVKGNKNAVV